MSKVVAPVLAVLVLLWSTACLAGQSSVLSEPPQNPTKEQRFLFFMHASWVERAGLDRPHPEYGRYEYGKIVKAFSEKGFTMISEVRTRRVDTEAYSQKIVGQINELLQKGVLPENVTVTGHSKGGHMALLVAAILNQPKVNFVIMAGGGRKGTRFGVGFQRFVNQWAASLQGRILSLFDESDRIADSCKEAFDRDDKQTLKSRETVFYTGKGHGLFYTPDSLWVDQVIEWARDNEPGSGTK